MTPSAPSQAVTSSGRGSYLLTPRLLSFLSLRALAHMRAMHASRVLGTRASAPCAVNRRRAKLRALCGCAVAKSTAKRALILRGDGQETLPRRARRSVARAVTRLRRMWFAVDAANRHLSKPWQLDLPRLDFANEVRNFDLCLRNDRYRPNIGHFFRCLCISPLCGPIHAKRSIFHGCKMLHVHLEM